MAESRTLSRPDLHGHAPDEMMSSFNRTNSSTVASQIGGLPASACNWAVSGAATAAQGTSLSFKVRMAS